MSHQLQEPLSIETLMNIFRTSPNDPLRIINRESSTVEFKEAYHHNNMAQYFRTIVAFANRSGGYIIFGVKDSPRKLIGLDDKHLNEFESLKPEIFTQCLNDYFSPEIRWEHCTFEFKNMRFGVIYIYELNKKPCICKKNCDTKNKKSSLKEGDIYYRYSGRSEQIHYTELAAIIDETRKKEAYQWFDLIKKVARIGVENSILLDLNTGKLSNKGATIIIDEKIISKIAFIHQGKFVETDGTPTLRVIGELEGINTFKMMIPNEKNLIKAIETDDVINAFLDNIKINAPLEYLKRACSDTSSYIPIYFILKQANMDLKIAIETVEKILSRNKSIKKKIIERLKGKKIPKTNIPESNKSSIAAIKNAYKTYWLTENITETNNVNYCMDALLSLTDSEIKTHNNYIKKILSKIFNDKFTKVDGATVTKIRKAICRVDEVTYFN